MTDYRRIYVPGATWFFTVNLDERKGNRLLVDDRIDILREAFIKVRKKHPYHIDAIAIVLDHLHCILTLPAGDTNFFRRWGLIKSHFSRSIEIGERISKSRAQRGERGIWQRHFWDHLIRDEADYQAYIHYIQWKSVKHGLVRRVADWKYSSFHEFVECGQYRSIGVMAL
ncbi:MAG: REP-associated tyrosine transposase [Methylobacter sp.]